jgi:hypothetical protein
VLTLAGAGEADTDTVEAVKTAVGDTAHDLKGAWDRTLSKIGFRPRCSA